MTSSVKLIRRSYETLSAGDVAGALSTLDPDVEWIEAESSPYGGPDPIRGPEAVLRAVWLPLQRDRENLIVEPGELIEVPSASLLGVAVIARVWRSQVDATRADEFARTAWQARRR